MSDNQILLKISLLDPQKIYFIGAAIASLLGVSYIYQNSKAKKEKIKRKEAMMKSQRGKASSTAQDSQRESVEGGNSRRKARKATLYFNQNDEIVSEEEALKDRNNFYHKYHTVVVDFGGDEEDHGTDQITKDIFWGTKKTDNALIFVENYEKSKKRH